MIKELQKHIDLAQCNAAPIREELSKVTKDYNDKIEKCFNLFNNKLEQYYDSVLLDINDVPIQIGNIVKDGKSNYKVTDRYLQTLFGQVFDNPRIVVCRIKEDGTLAKNKIDLYPSDLKIKNIEVCLGF